jgi:hypothetical protein
MKRIVLGTLVVLHISVSPGFATVASEEKPKWETPAAVLLFGSLATGGANAVLIATDGSTAPIGYAGLALGALSMVGGVAIASSDDSPNADRTAGVLLVTGSLTSFIGFLAVKHSNKRISVTPTVSYSNGRSEPGLALRISF